MADDNRTQGASNDAWHDPLDDLIAPILGRDVQSDMNQSSALEPTSDVIRHDPLDDLLPDSEPTRLQMPVKAMPDVSPGNSRRPTKDSPLPKSPKQSRTSVRHQPAKPEVHWPYDESGNRVVGPQTNNIPIGGWLIVVAAGLFFGPVFGAIQLWLKISIATVGTLPDESPGFNDLVLAESVIRGALLVFQVVLALLFFKQHPAVPKLMVCWLTLNLIGACVILIWTEQVSRERIDPVSFLARPLVMALIWIPYFAYSKRVQRTFGDPNLCSTPAKEMPAIRTANSQIVTQTAATNVNQEIELFTEEELGEVRQKAAMTDGRRRFRQDRRTTSGEFVAENKPAPYRSDEIKRKEPSRVRLGILVGTLTVLTGLLIANSDGPHNGLKPTGSAPPPSSHQGDGGQTIPEAFTPPQVADAPTLTPEELFARVSPSVVRVNVRNERSKPVGFGSGFFVRDDSTVITNYHVIEWAHSAEVALHDGTLLPVLGVLGVDIASDIAVLKVAHEPKKRIRHLSLGSNMLPLIGSKVYVIGAPEGLDSSLSDGLVSGHRERDDRLWIQISAPISPGSSGSPVLRADGAVIGIATWALHLEGQNLNFASPASGVESLIANKARFQKLPDLVLTRIQIVEDICRKTKDTQLSDAGRRIAAQNAIHQLDQLSASFRKTPMFWEYKGDIYFNQNQWDNAITAYHSGIAIDPDHPFLWGRIGEVHIIKQQYDDAVLALGLAVQVEQNNDKLWRDFGRSLLAVKRPKKAVVALRRSIAINPAKTSGHTTLGDALAELGDIEGGIAAYETALELEPNDFVCNFNYGKFLQRIRRYKDSIKVFEKARTLTRGTTTFRIMCDEELVKTRTLDRLR